jgi:hypothetical protein
MKICVFSLLRSFAVLRAHKVLLPWKVLNTFEHLQFISILMASTAASAPTSSGPSFSNFVQNILPLLEIGLIAGLAYMGYQFYNNVLHPLADVGKKLADSPGAGGVEILTGGAGGAGGLSIYNWWEENYGGSRGRFRAENAPAGLREAIRAQPDVYVKSREPVYGSDTKVIIWFNDVTYAGKNLSGLSMVDTRDFYHWGKPKPDEVKQGLDRTGDLLGNLFSADLWDKLKPK